MRIGEQILGEAAGARPSRLDEETFMERWKPSTQDKAVLKVAFEKFYADFKGEKEVLRLVKEAEKEAKNPGWGAVLRNLMDAKKAEEGAVGARGDGTVLLKAVKDVLAGITVRLAREDGAAMVYTGLIDKLKEMKQKGLTQGDMDNRYFEMEYPWLEQFEGGERGALEGKLFKAAEGGWAGAMLAADDKLKKAFGR